MNEEQKEGFRKLEAAGYLNSIREFAMARSAPFFWSSQEKGHEPKLLHNGTITYVATGQQELGVTNAHVYNQYVKDLAEQPGVEAQFGGNTIYPEKKLLAKDDKLDVAMLHVSKVFLDSSKNHKVHNRPASWPPKPLAPGEWVIYGGYPGALKEPKTGEIVWPFQSFTWRATDVTDSNIILHVDFPNLFWPGYEEKKMNDNLGGISGGPVFRIHEVLDPETKKVLKVGFELVGIIHEYSEMMDTVRARHIRHVLADGSLKPL